METPALSTTSHRSNGAKHIPAWKKLGLKLRSRHQVPSEVAQDSADTVHAESDIKKAKREVSEAAVEPPHSLPPSKKVKPSAPPSSSDPSPPNGDKNAQSTPNLKKRKSVTFTPETKVEDGDSVKQLFKAWVTEQKAEDPSFEPEKLGEAFKTSKPESKPAPVAERRVQGAKKQKKKKVSPKGGQPIQAVAGANSGHLHSAVHYLLNHYEARENWKFNKAKQSYLLKHLFDFGKIPADYDEALGDYISGLQGQAVRIRVQEAAEKFKRNKVVQDDPEEVISDKTRKSKRAGRLLSALGVVDRVKGSDTQNQDRTNQIKGSTKALGRKRKRRTLIDEGNDSAGSSSSKSDSTTSSDSDSDSLDSSEDSGSASSTSDSSSSDSSD